MGVPKFYRFVSERYPCINFDLNGRIGPAIDNFYVDMNGVVHNCARDSEAQGVPDSDRYVATYTGPRSNADIFLAVFKYLDLLFAMVQPQSLVFFAIDGVAPRAKMNQQRARRFRSAREREMEHEEKLRTNPMYKAANVKPFDSNCITPGTEFMAELTMALNYFVHKRVSEDAAWGRVEVVLSGAEVPGEGEHKIMEYIRAMKLANQIPPDTRHCVYGLDADLIMLSLVTHEPHFVLLREKVDFAALYRRRSSARPASRLDVVEYDGFQLLSTGLLREYVAMDVGCDGVSKEPFFDIERVVDDFVMIAMLIGNDFLPNLPSIDITEGALGTILTLYKRLLPRFGGYLVERGTVVPDRFELFALLLGLLEVDILTRRHGVLENSGRGGRRGRITPKSDPEHDIIWGFEESVSGSRPWTKVQLKQELRRVRQEVRDFNDPASKKQVYYQEKFGIDVTTKDGASKLRKIAVSYMEGLCWTLKYYFEGCASWRWFYPYHYAPMASDLMFVADLLQGVSLTMGTPFKPVEQLLSVLPPSSAWCLPKPFRRLMTHSDSPIHDKFPEIVETDMNGKMNDWEAVVLLPFIGEKELVAAVMTVSSSELTSAERERNCHGDSLVYRRQTGPQASLSTVKSPFPDRLPDIMSEAAVWKLELPFIAHGVPFPSTWVHGTHAAAIQPNVADLPSLSGVNHFAQLASIGVNVFGTRSRNESLRIGLGCEKPEERNFYNLEPDDDFYERSHRSSALRGSRMHGTFPEHCLSVDAAVKSGFDVGDTVWIGYPWRVAGVIECVWDASKERIRDLKSEMQEVKEQLSNSGNFETVSRRTTADLLENKGIDAGNAQVIFGVRHATDKNPLTGFPIKVASKIAFYPAAVVFKMKDDDMNGLSKVIAQFLKRGDRKMLDVKLGDLVLYVGRGPLFGCLARVRDVRADGHLAISYSVRPSFAKEPAFAYRVVTKHKSSEQWYSMSRAASSVSLPLAVLGSITGSIRVRVPDNNREEIDVGLGIKYAVRGLVVPGYAKLVDRKICMLSEAAVKLIAEYKRCFPDLFDALVKLVCGANGNKQNNGGCATRAFDATELFGKGPAVKDALTAAATWIGTREIATLPLISEDAAVLSKSTVAELEREQVIAKALQEEGMSQGDGDKRKAFAVVPRNLIVNGSESVELYASLAGSGAIPSCKEDASDIRLGDRVVNRLAVGPVPFGLRGTVVGIRPAKDVRQNDDLKSDSGSMPGDVENSSGTGRGVGRTGSEAVVEIVFDEGFIAGGDLNGRCSAGRGKAVSSSSLLLLRPDCENPFYQRHYGRIANAFANDGVGRPRRDADDARERKMETSAVANAAIRSYLAAANAGIAAERGRVVYENSASSYKEVSGSRVVAIEDSLEDIPVPSFAKKRDKAPSLIPAHLHPKAQSLGTNAHEFVPSQRPDANSECIDNVRIASDVRSVEARLKQMMNLAEPSDDHDGCADNENRGSGSSGMSGDGNCLGPSNQRVASRGRSRGRRSRARASKVGRFAANAVAPRSSAVGATEHSGNVTAYSDDDMLQLWKQLHENGG